MQINSNYSMNGVPCETRRKQDNIPQFSAYVVRKGQALSDYACDPLGWRKNVRASKHGQPGLFPLDICHLINGL